MPNLLGILETSLYVEEFERACAFYEQVLGLNSIYRDPRLCAYDVDGRSVLLLFLRGHSLETVQLPGGTIPPHDGHGPVHIAFSIAADALPAWKRASRKRPSPSRAAPNGRAAARAFISATPMGICSSWRRRVCGRGFSSSPPHGIELRCIARSSPLLSPICSGQHPSFPRRPSRPGLAPSLRGALATKQSRTALQTIWRLSNGIAHWMLRFARNDERRTKKEGGTPTDAVSIPPRHTGAARSSGTRSPVGVPPRLLPLGLSARGRNFRPGFLGRGGTFDPVRLRQPGPKTSRS